MLITDRFIIINLPKTGSTFVRRALKRLHGHWTGTVGDFLAPMRKDRRAGTLQVLKLPNIRYHNDRRGVPDEHGTYCQIPPYLLRGREIVTVVRNPLERYISAYLYGYWRQAPFLDSEEAAEEYPHFPDLSFKEYVYSRTKYMVPTMYPGISISRDIGMLTVQFIQYLFRNPEETLKRIDRRYIESGIYLDEMPKIRFLKTENLRGDLHEFLRSHGYSRRKIAFLLKAKKANTKRTPKDTVDHYYDEALKQFVLEKEKLIFDLFPEYLPS